VASSPSWPPLATVLYLYLAVAFTAMVTVFRARRFLRGGGDYRAYLLYFACFALTLLVVPIGIVAVASASPLAFLAAIGLRAGRSGLGLLFVAIALPVAPVAAWLGARDPAMREQYPFSKQACASPGRFAVYEGAYLVLYYLPWEFIFRGLLFFPLVAAIGLGPALAVQTIVSTLYHVGHPDAEIVAALGAGIGFGLIAYATGSFLYTVAIHALVGVSTDTILYRRRKR
jgi:membrane protease YdiL (CAAX protease family)